MNNRALLVTLWLGILLVGAPVAALADVGNLLKDPSFESKLSSDQGGWMLFEDSQYSRDQARSGRQSMFNWAFSRTIAFPPFLVGSVSGSYQEFPAGPGSRWQLTGFGLTATQLKGTPAFGILQVSFFDDSGKDLGTVETADSRTARAKTSNEVNGQTPVGQWIFLDSGIATAPQGTATVQAFTLYVDYSGANISQGVYFDDLRLCTFDGKDPGSVCKEPQPGIEQNVD